MTCTYSTSNTSTLLLNYLTDCFSAFLEIALQQVSMFFRSDLKWEVLEPLKDMGKS